MPEETVRSSKARGGRAAARQTGLAALICPGEMNAGSPQNFFRRRQPQAGRVDLQRVNKIATISVAPLFAEAIRRIHTGESVGALFDPPGAEIENHWP